MGSLSNRLSMAKKPDAITGEWLCKRVEYEQSDELLARMEDASEHEKPAQSAAKTEFARATLMLSDKGGFELRAPEIASDPIVTGAWKKKGKTITATTADLHYGTELHAIRSNGKRLELLLRLGYDSYDTHDLLVLVFARGADQSAMLGELGQLDIWEQESRLREELDDDDTAISELLWGAFSRSEWPADGGSAALLARFPGAATVEGLARFVATQDPDPDVELEQLLAAAPEGEEAPIREAMSAAWLEELAQGRMLTLTDARFFASVRAALFPQPAFDRACLAHAMRSDVLNLDAILAITSDASVDRVRAMTRYIGPNRFDRLVEACDAIAKEAAIEALTAELESRVPHWLLNVAHALDALAAAPAALAAKRKTALDQITTYVLTGKFTNRDFEIMTKLGVNTASLRVAITAD